MDAGYRLQRNGSFDNDRIHTRLDVFMPKSKPQGSPSDRKSGDAKADEYQLDESQLDELAEDQLDDVSGGLGFSRPQVASRRRSSLNAPQMDPALRRGQIDPAARRVKARR